MPFRIIFDKKFLFLPGLLFFGGEGATSRSVAVLVVFCDLIHDAPIKFSYRLDCFFGVF